MTRGGVLHEFMIVQPSIALTGIWKRRVCRAAVLFHPGGLRLLTL
jgi:hypothetical protein